MVTIQNPKTGEKMQYSTLDSALRTIKGADGLPLLMKVGRKTFEQASALLATVGLEVVREKQAAEFNPEEVRSIARELFNAGASAMYEKVGTMMAKNDELFASSLALHNNRMADAMNTIQAKLEEVSRHRRIEVAVQGKTPIVMDRQHEEFPTLLATIGTRSNAMLVGPAGSGKTTGAEKAAEALSIPYYSISVGMQTTKTEFFGYMDASGRYVRTLFREAYENGGVFLIDEMDAGNANVIVAINQALANTITAFPDGMVKKHRDFVIVASANTWGTGASVEYVGRNQLDAATLDRFVVITWGYDEVLEDSMVGNKKWLNEVRRIRRIVMDKKIRAVVGPRASIVGEKLLAAGLSWEKVKEMVILKGMNDTDKKLVG